jgi:hypothetical protein
VQAGETVNEHSVADSGKEASAQSTTTEVLASSESDQKKFEKLMKITKMIDRYMKQDII